VRRQRALHDGSQHQPVATIALVDHEIEVEVGRAATRAVRPLDRTVYDDLIL